VSKAKIIGDEGIVAQPRGESASGSSDGSAAFPHPYRPMTMRDGSQACADCYAPPSHPIHSRDNVRSHITWSIEHPIGECPFCGDKTVLLVAPGLWDADEEAAIEAIGEDRYEEGYKYDGVMIHEELTGHYCGTCEKLTSMSLNTMP
jgi:hypothetical protein